MSKAPSQPLTPKPDTTDTAPFLQVPDPLPEKNRRNPFAINRTLTGHVLRMSLPVVAGMLTQTAVNILDGAMVGRLPKEIANPGQTAIGVALPFMWLVGGFLSAIWVGTQALASRRAGEGNDKAAGAVLTNAMLIATVSSLVFSVFFYFLTPVILNTFYNEVEARTYAIEYLQIRYLGIWAMVGTFTLKSFFDGIGRTHMFMVAAITMNLLNVVLNFLLIYGYAPLGIPRLEIAGAAWASMIAAYSGFVLLAIWGLAPHLVRRYQYFNPKNFSRKIMKSLIGLSLPSALATTMVTVSLLGFHKVVDHVASLEHDDLIRTAATNVLNLGLIAIMVGLASGSATGAMVNQALGAKRKPLAEAYLWEAVRIWGYVMAIGGGLLFLFPEAALEVLTRDAHVTELATTPLRIFALVYPLTTMGIIMEQSLYGVGHSRFVMWVELFMHCLVLTPIAYLAAVVLDFGALGIFFGPATYFGLLCLIMTFKFRFSDWKSVEI